MGELTTRALDETTWPAFADLAERHNGVWGGCWCLAFHPKAAEMGDGPEGYRRHKGRLVREDRTHAAVVLDGDTAVGWAQYGTPDELPRIYHRKEYESTVTTWPDYRITCFFVGRGHRRAGVAEAALHGVLDLVAAAGGGLVEGYPYDVSDGKKLTGSSLYAGSRAMFERAGFTYDRPKGKNHCVMWRQLDGA